MTEKKKLIGLIENLKKEGFPIGNFEIDEENKWHNLNVEESYPSLGLISKIGIYANYHSDEYPSILKPFTLLQDNLPTNMDFTVWYDDFMEDWSEKPINPSEWRNLPKKMKRDKLLLDRLKRYISPSKENVKLHNGECMQGKTWGNFFGQLVKEKKLRLVETEKKIIPYVLADKYNLRRDYYSIGGLNFVAEDLVDPFWDKNYETLACTTNIRDILKVRQERKAAMWKNLIEENI